MPQAVDKENDPIYEVEAWGTYWTYDAGQFDNFRHTFRLSHRDVNELGIGSVLKVLINEMFKDLLNEKTGEHKFPNFRRHRKIYHGPAVKISGRTLTRKPEMMGREELLKYMQDWNDGEGMAIETDLFNSVAELRTAVKEYEADPTGFLNRQADLMEKKGAKLLDKKAALKLNGVDNTLTKGVDVKLPKAPKNPKGKKKAADDEDYD